MSDTARLPDASDTAMAVMALHSALRRRGIAVTDGDLPGSVRAEHAGRRVDVRYSDRHWWRTMPGDPRVTVPIAPEGSEHTLARDLVAELLGRL
ncbi:hypothetical protein [Nocardiopsis sp. CC223A]|uniref:hypothetical protein n=1 Tax=Nocardiopsis sp. CC223A TaxID=3044051 RepID=UPI00278BDB18|nr:hypothetical protein [Nocardiopsis sp. CC223A]